jgi:hypothetical protein
LLLGPLLVMCPVYETPADAPGVRFIGLPGSI